MFIVRTSAKGQVVIPAPIRQLIGLEPGQQVRVEVRNDEIVLTPLPKDVVAALTGLCKGGPSLTEDLLKMRKEDRNLETKKFARFLRNDDVAQ